MTILQLVGATNAPVQLEEAIAVRIWAGDGTGSVPVRYGEDSILQQLCGQ